MIKAGPKGTQREQARELRRETGDEVTGGRRENGCSGFPENAKRGVNGSGVVRHKWKMTAVVHYQRTELVMYVGAKVGRSDVHEMRPGDSEARGEA